MRLFRSDYVREVQKNLCLTAIQNEFETMRKLAHAQQFIFFMGLSDEYKAYCNDLEKSEGK